MKKRNKVHYIYKIWFLCGFPTGRYYIGKRSYCGSDLTRDRYTGSGKFCDAYFKKYGKKSGVTYIKEILEINPSAEINKDREDFWIGDLWKTDLLCMNQCSGGCSWTGPRGRAKSTKRFAKINQYDLNGKFIKTWDSIKDIIIELGFEENAGRARLWDAYSHKNKTAYGFVWRKYTGDTNDIDPGKISDVKGKPISQYDSKGNFIQTFPSVRSAAKSIGAQAGNILMAVRKKTSAYGFQWRYASENKTSIEQYKRKFTSPKQYKSVLQYSVLGEFLKEWPSAQEAAFGIGRPKAASGIKALCRNGKTGYGFKWKYKENKIN